MEYQFNPYSPIGYGAAYDTPEGYVDRAFPGYVYDQNLLANQTLLNQTVSITADADFYLHNIWISYAVGGFAFRWADSSGYYFATSPILSQNFSTFSAQPTPIVPAIYYPAGGRIILDIVELSGAPNTIQICFGGIKRFRRNN